MTGSMIGLIVTIIILFIIIVIRQIDWRQKAVEWVGNNPARAQVYVHAGHTSQTVQGTRVFQGTTKCMVHEVEEWHEVSVYRYQLVKDYHLLIFVDDTTYDYDYIRGRRILGVNDGVLVPNPLGNSDETMRGKYREGILDLSMLHDSQVEVQALKSLKSNRLTNWMIYGLVLLVVAGGIYYYISNNSKQAAQPAAQPPAVEQPAQAPYQPGPSANITIITGEKVIN